MVLRGRCLVLVTLLLLLVPVIAVPPAAAAHEYAQSVWFSWNTTELRVLVHGVDDPLIAAAIKDAISSWETGIAQLADPWLADSFRLIVYFPALDPVPPPGFQPQSAHIQVVPQGFMAIKASAGPCIATAPMLAGFGSMYHVALHEIGHCLGLDHVFSHGVEYAPAFDALGGGESGFRSCPSNLNIMVLERVFSGQLGPVTISAADYRQASC